MPSAGSERASEPAGALTLMVGAGSGGGVVDRGGGANAKLVGDVGDDRTAAGGG